MSHIRTPDDQKWARGASNRDTLRCRKSDPALLADFQSRIVHFFEKRILDSLARALRNATTRSSGGRRAAEPFFARPIEVEDGGPKQKTRACYAY
jgi:hypothetical protein